MTLSDTVRASVAAYCETDLSPETRFGKSNRVDFAGRSPLIGDIRVELERRRQDPVNNVVKAWRHAIEDPTAPPFILVQVFSGFYSVGNGSFENARFIGDMMNAWADTANRRIAYVSVLLDFEPPKGDADPLVDDVVARDIREQICRQLEGRINKKTRHDTGHVTA